MRGGLRSIVISGTLAVPLLAGSSVTAGFEIPFEFLHNQIVLGVAIDGSGPYNFIVDTGTHASTIDSGLVRSLGLPLSGEAVVGGVGTGQPRGQRTTIPKLQIGMLLVPSLEAVALDLSMPSRALGRPLHGVLGSGFLESRIVQIDYFQRKVRFYERSPETAERAISFRMQFHTGSVLPILEDCYVNGVRLSLTLDTGSSMGLVLFPDAVSRLGFADLARQGIPMEASGYLGQARLIKGWVRSVRLGNIDLGAIEVAYVQKGYADNERMERRGGNLGNAVLQDFIVTLDYRNRMIILESTLE